MKHLIRARLFMLVAAAIWGTSFVVGRVGVSYINPFAFAFLENCIGLCILVLGLRLQERKVPASQGSNILMIPESVLLGLLNGLAYTLQYVGLSLTTAINTSLLVNVSMPFVPLIAWALLKERPSLRRIGGLLIGIGGAILVTTKGEVALLIGGELLGPHTKILTFFRAEQLSASNFQPRLCCLPLVASSIASRLERLVKRHR
jgi:drug/metabolite transporter (DMT)-like permease